MTASPICFLITYNFSLVTEVSGR